MKKRYHLLFILFILLCYACEEDIQLDLSGNKKLVLLGNFQPDSLIKLSLSTSIPIGSPGAPLADYPADARIQLFKDGQYLSDFTFVPLSPDNFSPYYISEHRPQLGSNYAVKAQYKDYPEASAESSLPPAPQVQTLEVMEWEEEIDAYTPSLSFYLAKVKLPLNLPTSTTSYYHLFVKRQVIEYEVRALDTLKSFYVEDLYTSMPLVDNSALVWGSGHLIESTQLDASNPALEVEFNFVIDHDYELKGLIYFELRQVNRAYYRFHKSREEQDVANYQQSILYSEPVLIYNNIEGGLGHFSGFHALTQRLDW